MIYCVEGVLLALTKFDGFCIAALKCESGIGFEIKVSFNTARLIENKEKVFLFTSFILRENLAELFGFYDLKERDCFKLLICVSGVGPSFALSILSFLTPFEFFRCVSLKDSEKLCECKGIGKKTASRIILELKDKIKNFAFEEVDEAQDVKGFSKDAAQQAIEALIVLGYGKAQAKEAVMAQNGEKSVESLIKDALLILSGK